MLSCPFTSQPALTTFEMDDLDGDVDCAETQASQMLSRCRASHTSSSDSSTLSTEGAISHHSTHVERYQSAHIQHVSAVGSHSGSRTIAANKSQAIPRVIGGGNPFPPGILAEREAYVVDFDDPDSLQHPVHWETS